ncbi:glycosyltransferase [Neobacillus notoginsengisoli]|uniref:Glycosyltransferase n=1 Tax=Neobacillus notoginsengisoli TaxID=1578198 RepID=A0A417YGZ7_9BACI|nr:glycosyltransferase [Neobacillus notoginsengisoli]RHW32108.1 glycosyltransferase [Neobacillus notoginsengisoli]
MKRCLVVLTCWYPYTQYGEQFFNSEIKYLSRNFDRVILIPCFRTANTPDVREIPFKNVEVKRLERKSKVMEILKTGHKLMTNKAFWTELKYLYTNKILNKKTVEILFIYTINQEVIKRKVKEELKGIDFTEWGEIILYSYWFSSLAGAVSNLKNEIIKANPKIKLKAISRAHGTSDVYGGDRLNFYLPYREEYYKSLDLIFSVSENGKKFLSEKIKDSSKLRTSRLGTKDYCLNNEIVFNIKEKETFTIVSCSNIVNVKRVHLIIEALAYISKYNIKWVHFGEGVLKEEVKGLAKKLPMNIKVELKGAISNEVIMNYYSKKTPHLFINVSESEGMPVSIIEAMSFGIPIIATNVGGTSEAVIDNKCGYLIEKDFKVIQLSKLIVKFIEMDNGTYQKIRQNCRNHWEHLFDENNNYNEFCTEIKSFEKGEEKL